MKSTRQPDPAEIQRKLDLAIAFKAACARLRATRARTLSEQPPLSTYVNGVYDDRSEDFHARENEIENDRRAAEFDETVAERAAQFSEHALPTAY
jgi:hypothetical protein